MKLFHHGRIYLDKNVRDPAFEGLVLVTGGFVCARPDKDEPDVYYPAHRVDRVEVDA